ncbi:MAG TPA: methyl-accepting chemotaxis protein [Candidimonas sp.]|nr:methyl-accepting chemotaxis protein [Candidimonas sp.]
MKIFTNMRIGNRLGLGFAVVLALALVITSIGVWRLYSISQTTQYLMAVPLEKERLISDWYRNLTNGINRTMAIAKSTDPALGPFFAKQTAAATNESTELQKKIIPLLVADEEKELFKLIMEYRKVYLSTRDAMTKKKVAGDTEEATRIFTQEFIPGADKYQESVRKLVESQRVFMDKTGTEIAQANAMSRQTLLTLAVIMALFSIIFAWRLTTGITHPLRRAVDAARRVASGDLSGQIAVHSTDETGQLLQSLKDMTANLLTLIGNVRSGTQSIATASSEIASGNLDLSSRTEEQASSLTETASAMEELTNTVKQTADNAQQANQLVQATSVIASKGGEATSEVVTTMESINQSAHKIVDIIGVIDGIAFQTNILALNAAVEAARDGEQGKGLAVVATEVRSLAQRSATAAKEIKTLINDAVGKIETGGRLVQQAGSTIDEVVASVKRVTDIVGEISMASNEQSIGIEQVNQAILQMDQVTQQNAALVEQAAAATGSMQDQADHLTRAVSVFNLGNYALPIAPVRQEASALRPKAGKPASLPKAKAPRKAAVPALAPARLQAAGGNSDWEEF